MSTPDESAGAGTHVEPELAQRPAFHADIAQLLTVAAAVIDRQGTLQAANAGFLRLCSTPAQITPGARVSRLFIQPNFATLVRTAAQTAGGYCGLMTVGEIDGTTRTLRGRVNATAEGIRVVAEYDIDDLERLNAAMLELNRELAEAQDDLARANVDLRRSDAANAALSLTDALTGAGNRRKLDESLPVEISRARRGNVPLSIVMADIDHFKRVNDNYGHSAGDRVLARFGSLLRESVRATDLVARFGGEEFIVLLVGAELDAAVAKAERLRAAVESQSGEPLPCAITASFGVAKLRDEDDAKSLLARVDAALYRAKEGGRNRVVSG